MKLIVRNRGQEVTRFELESGREYFAGRSRDCAVVLEGAKAISRQHVKFFERNGIWVAQLISRFSGMIYEGQSVQILELNKGAVFNIENYEFSIEEAEVVSVPQSSNAIAIRDQNQSMVEDDAFAGNIEATVAGFSTLEPFLKVQYGTTQKAEVFRLEGNVWVAGREPQCEIFLDDRQISRRHFELSRTHEGIYIADLGSANGTQVNGEALVPHEPFKISSGDKINILDVEIDFELRDAQFDSKASSLVPSAYVPPQDQFLPQEYQPPSPLQRVERSAPPQKDFKKLGMRVGLGIGGLLLIIGLMSGGKKTKVEETSSSSNDSVVSFDKMTLEKQTAVKDSFNLARNLYVGAKYELCLQELKKLHLLVPFYDNSKELVTLCEQGADFAKVKADLDYKEQEKLRQERELKSITDTCQEKLSAHPDMAEAELQNCLSPAIEIDPGNAKVVELTSILKARSAEREDKARSVQQKQGRLRNANVLFQKAKQKVKAGKLREGIDEFDRLLSLNYPEAQQLRSQAQREVASVQQQLNQKVERLLSSCKDNLNKAHFRLAYEACANASKEDPKNTGAQSLIKQSLSELRREMKAIYEDSVIEESLGNIDAAKEKWHRLLTEDLSSDDYYIKAKLKLQKYGVGI